MLIRNETTEFEINSPAQQILKHSMAVFSASISTVSLFKSQHKLHQEMSFERRKINVFIKMFSAGD